MTEQFKEYKDSVPPRAINNILWFEFYQWVLLASLTWRLLAEAG